MVEAAWRLGTGAGGTRNISGNSNPIVELEAELADLHGKEAALVFTSGYVSNQTGISTLAKLIPNCLILSDALNHNSMIEGVRQSGSTRPSSATTIWRTWRNCSRPLATGPSSSCSRASIPWMATSPRSMRSAISPSATAP
jgi:hypothetical protein